MVHCVISRARTTRPRTRTIAPTTPELRNGDSRWMAHVPNFFISHRLYERRQRASVVQYTDMEHTIRCVMRYIKYAKAQVPNLVVPSEGCHARERRVLSFGSLVLPVLVLDHLGLTGGHEHAVHDGSLSPISYPPDRMVPLSDRRRSGVASNFASKLHTPQGPSHSLLDCIHPGEVDCP